MYFPILRGRQFELIAIRELSEEGLLSKKIIPIIEPVKLSSTLSKTISMYGSKGQPLALIYNPLVGTFDSDLDDEKNRSLVEAFNNEISANDNLLYAFRLNLESQKEIVNFIAKYSDRMMTICSDKDAIPLYTNEIEEIDSKYNLIPDESGFRRKIRKNRVMLDDKFTKMARNTDYAKKEDEPFSEDHLFYLDDGYVGFADYSMVGDEYSDSGFAPYAVAIHIVYFANDKSLRIKHFVSDTNDDIKDPAGKFKEAVEKLVEWNKIQKLDTKAIKEFEDLYYREAYPGLGTVKKLSIMHHIELMGRFLDEE